MSNTTPQFDVNLLQAAIGAIAEAVIITGPYLDDPGPAIVYVNPGFTKLTGYSLEEVLGRSPRFLQGRNTDRGTLDKLRACLVAGRLFKGEAINYRKDGSEYLVEWLITPVRGPNGITHWVAAQRDVTEQRREQEHSRSLAAEVNHRVNNSLAAMQSVAALAARSATTTAEFKTVFQRRLRALANIHRLLSRTQWSGVHLVELATSQVSLHCIDLASRFMAVGPNVVLRPGAAVALGMALSELAMNALRHGAWSVPDGSAQLRWAIEASPAGERLGMHWEEAGGPPLAGDPPRRGFGTRLIERGLPQELLAETKLAFDPSGFQCDINVALTTIRASPNEAVSWQNIGA